MAISYACLMIVAHGSRKRAGMATRGYFRASATNAAKTGHNLAIIDYYAMGLIGAQGYE